ncbi:MAG: single-stranded-DNA-specific exonuclease RecJ [Leptolinea sp.]|jgi:single-stranded-DNA-specific exonuclease|nr:single-stranded-DNA-specific exonuclease RecJ [Leptolinea sp.]
MEREWKIKSPGTPPADLLNFVDGNSIVAGYLMERGITTSDRAIRFLHPDRRNLTDPQELPDMEKAVERIRYAIDHHESIGIWGDFDVDGQTATAILVECLSGLGAQVNYHLPVRGRESHGISLPVLKDFLRTGIQLLITCDTGISENEAIFYTMGKGVDVIVTDHHTLPEELPPALACINPRRLSEDHALGSLSGSGTAFELMLAVCRFCGREELAFESIDLAAIGLIADLAPLKLDSRLMAQLGLQRMTARPRAWISSMLETAGLPVSRLDEQTIGFLLAPRLNAAGRLEDANPLVGFLMDCSPETIKNTAEHLETLNANRKWLCDQVYQAARDRLERQRELADDPVIILSNPTWTGGVLGLAAGRLAADYNRPTILLNDSTDGMLRGSARSIEGVNITEAIASAAACLHTYGGHPMAAGLSLPTENLPEFRRLINTWLRQQGLVVSGPSVLEIDAELSLSQVNREFYRAVKSLAPFGKENPALVFCSRQLEIATTRPLGRNREHFKFVLKDDSGNSLPMVWWNADESRIPSGKFDLAYSISENEYKGEITLQAEWIDGQSREETEIEFQSSHRMKVVDFRSSPNPLKEAISACGNRSYLIYEEPPRTDNPFSSGRYHLYSSDILILASLPPSPQVFEQILTKTNFASLFLAYPPSTSLAISAFLKQLAGYIKFAVEERTGLASLQDLAEVMNENIQTIDAGIQWFSASGKIKILAKDDQLYKFSLQNHAAQNEQVQKAESLLQFLMNEKQSYLRYFSSLSNETLSSLMEKIRNEN